MTSYEVHHGVGRPLEFMGLKSIYIFMMPAAALMSITTYFLLTMSSLSGLTCIVASLSLAITLVSAVMFLNRKYGEKGINMTIAYHLMPEQIINNKRLFI